MTPFRRLFAVAAAATMLAIPATATATDAPEQAEPTDIEGGTWLLRAQAASGDIRDLPPGIVVSLKMDSGEAGGTGGCSDYSTSYEISDSSITFGPIESTRQACAGTGDIVEAIYLDNLGAAASWASDGTTLTFSDASGRDILGFEAAPEASVVGSWRAIGINDGAEAVVSSETTPLVTANFTPEGDLNGFDGCNDYFTTYQVEGDRISIATPIGSTRKACPEGELMDQTQSYYAALEAASTWAADAAGDLELRDESGALQVRYMPAR